jgi:hypothetical protein
LEIEDYETSTSDDDVESVDEDNEWVEDHGDNSDGDYNHTDDSEDENDGEAHGNGAVRDAVEFLKKTRCLVRMVRKSGIVSGFVTKRIKALETNPGVNFILDFHVRWNSTYLMLKRLKKLKCIADEITNNTDAIFGLKAKQRTKLESLHLSNEEWIICDILLNILHPFFEATKMLSGRNYPTLAISFLIQKHLSCFLSNVSNTTTKEKQIKSFLFRELKYHLFTKITTEQERVTKVSCNLNFLS